MKALVITAILSVFIVGILYLLGGPNPLSKPHNQVTWIFSKSATDLDLAEESPTNPLNAATIILVLCVMLFMPFWPGLRESLWPRDEYPMPIEMEYSKDPRYLGKSFRKTLLESLGTDRMTSNIREVHLSKDETIEIKKSCRIKTGDTIPYTLLVRNDMHTASHVKIEQDLYVIGKAHIGKHNQIRTLACDGDIVLDSTSCILRWIDAEGKMHIGSGCDLGASCSAVDALILGDNVVFRRLFGSPIITPEHIERTVLTSTDRPDTALPDGKIKNIEDIAYYRKKSTSLQKGTAINQDIIIKGDLKIAEGMTINGSVRCQGRTTVGRKSMIRGDLFSEGPVDVFQGATIMGNIFTQDAIHLYRGSRVGKAGNIKSVIAKKKIILDRDVSIYGYVLTEGKGMVI